MQTNLYILKEPPTRYNKMIMINLNRNTFIWWATDRAGERASEWTHVAHTKPAILFSHPNHHGVNVFCGTFLFSVRLFSFHSKYKTHVTKTAWCIAVDCRPTQCYTQIAFTSPCDVCFYAHVVLRLTRRIETVRNKRVRDVLKFWWKTLNSV